MIHPDYIEYHRPEGSEFHCAWKFNLIRIEDTPTPKELADFITAFLKVDGNISCYFYLPSHDANYQFMIKVAGIVAPWQFRTAIQKFGSDWDSEYCFVTADQKRKR